MKTLAYSLSSLTDPAPDPARTRSADHRKPIRTTSRNGTKLQVRGVVQGVGFRPFIYRIATEEDLAGSIGNDTDGVAIEIEGPLPRIEAFLARLRSRHRLWRESTLSRSTICACRRNGFRIVSSEVKGQVCTGIPADAATCADCLHELFDPADRRYRYPFLNCTNCGPRFTITRRIPYDRPQTSMARSPCAQPARPNTTIPSIAAFTPSPMPAATAARASGSESPDGSSIPCRRSRCRSDPEPPRR